MRQAIRILRDEHRSIAAVLHGLNELAQVSQETSARPDFAVFRAMIYYIDTFPERLHHPKEDAVLFPRVEARSAQAASLLEKLRADHQRGAELIRELERAVTAFEMAWPDGASQFAAAVKTYADFHWEHMRSEEDVLLPLAEKVLTAEDWQAVDEAFAGNEDPLSDLRQKDFAELFSRIVAIAPAPIGLGKPWARRAA
ncbi:MAG TPA: hemerythrin domain-containing protein [Burkholderiales bacterium]|nr:hemerythrin domain-containing protein [Burkholderiales bacterium]